MRAPTIIPLVCVLAGGCVSATFHGRTAAPLPPVADRAVIVGPGQAGAVAGRGELVGTIDAAGATTASQDDLTDQAAEVAAAHGGTHVVVSAAGEVTRTSIVPATTTRTCTHGDGTRTCTTTYEPETTATTSTPYSELDVYRVEPARWQELPGVLRPTPYDPARHVPTRSDGPGVTIGGFSAPLSVQASGTSGEVFPTAYTRTATGVLGVWIAGSFERGDDVLAVDLRLGGASYGGTARSLADGTAAVPYQGTYVGTGLALRLGKRLAWRNVAIAAGPGIAGAVYASGVPKVDHSAPDQAGFGYSFVEPPDDTITDLAIPLWTAVTVKATCSLGVQGLAEYDWRPTDRAASATSFSLGLQWQPASACR